MRAVLALFLCLLVRQAFSSPIAMWGAETPDSTASTTNVDALDVTTTSTADGSARDALISSAPNCIPHNDKNGGHVSSLRSYCTNTSSGQTGYFTTPAAADCTAAGDPWSCCTGSSTGCISPTQGSAAFAWHLDSDSLSVAFRHAGFLEGANAGCTLLQNSDKTQTLCYRDCENAACTASGQPFACCTGSGTGTCTGINIGTTTWKAQPTYCSSTASTCTTNSDCSPDLGYCADDGTGTKRCQNWFRGCADNTDCVSPQTCRTCSTTHGGGCYYANEVLTQTNQGSSVICELRIDGSLVIASGARPISPGPSDITAFRWGNVSGPTGGSVVASTDSVVIDNDTDAGIGWVGVMVPTADGAEKDWIANTCGSPLNSDEQCFDDWESGGLYDGTGTSGVVRATQVGQRQTIAAFSSFASGGVRVTAVEPVLFGQDSGGTGAGAIALKVGLCDGTMCPASGISPGYTADATDTLNYPAGTHGPIAHGVFLTAPDETDTAWDDTNLAKLGISWSLASRPSSSTTRVGGVIVNVRGERPNAPVPFNLTDRNLGADDGVIVVAMQGHSVVGSTFSGTCQGGSNAGTACSQAFYCAGGALSSDWAVTHDKPVGGCSGDGDCQGCAGNSTHPKSGYRGGTGYPCGPNNLTDLGANGTCNLGTCSGGFCTGDTAVSCTVDGDCDLGTCDSCGSADCSSGSALATCTESCPNGNCPTNRTSPADWLPGNIGADTVIRCARGGETSYENLASGNWYDRLNGTDTAGYCTILQYDPDKFASYGHCGCSSGSDCSGGTCAGGVCTTGAYATCLIGGTTQCLNSNTCHLPPVDYALFMDYTNDPGAVVGTGDPQCAGLNGAAAMNTGSECANCPESTCDTDSDCTGRSSQSTCDGARIPSGLFAGGACLRDTVFGSTVVPCNQQIQSCNVTSQCPSSFTCRGGTGSTSSPKDTGYCACDADSDCTTAYGSGLKCVLDGVSTGRCRRTCSVNGDCGTGGVCSGGACFGICTCPCDSNDMTSYPKAAACTSDSQCPGVARSEGVWGPQITRRYQGACVSGSCKYCGRVNCSDGTAAGARAASRWNEPHSHLAIRGYKSMLSTMAAASDSDGTPLLVFSIEPFPNQLPCAENTRVEERSDFTYYARVGAHLRTDPVFSGHVVDVANLFAPSQLLPVMPYNAGLFSDQVHFNGTGAQRAGYDGFATFLNALNVCALYAGTPQQRARTHCKNADNTWPGTPAPCGEAGDASCTGRCTSRECTSNSDCGGGSTCNTEPAS